MRDPDDVQVHATDKPILYTASGEPVIVKKPFGFAGHPAVPQEKLKKGDKR